MKTHVTGQLPPAIEPQEVRQELERILSSRYFANAHQKKRFLRLICDFYLEGRAHEINEYLLAYDIFGRETGYSPAADPIVRVFAHEIRKKLETYYDNEGADDPLRLEIPAGSYQPLFTRCPPATTAADADPAGAALAHSAGEPGRRYVSFRTLGIIVACLCLAIVIVGLAVSNRQLRQQLSEAETAPDLTAYGEVWAPFLRAPKPPLVILSNPPVLRATNPSDPEAVLKDAIPLTPEAVGRLKDKLVTNPEIAIGDSHRPGGEPLQPPGHKVGGARNRPPALILSTNFHTGIGEAIGLHYLTDLFRKADRGILLKQSRTASADDLKTHNVIVLGGLWVNEWSSKLSKTEDFVFTGRATIENRNPQPGEEREYISQFDGRTGSLIADYALITVKPNISETHKVMLLAGAYSQGTEAAAEYVTNKTYLDQLNQRLRQAQESGGPPRYFQALLRVRVENGIPTTITLLALHELRLPQL